MQDLICISVFDSMGYIGTGYPHCQHSHWVKPQDHSFEPNEDLQNWQPQEFSRILLHQQFLFQIEMDEIRKHTVLT